ncbi:MAG: carbohydrate ABC transporter permease, partial [Treponema sp.]|nr:carbohydrate ABC transporter permease [Treponema sp.]
MRKTWKNDGPDIVFRALVLFITVTAFFIVAYPLYWIVIASVSNSNQVNLGAVWFLPRDINFYGFEKVFQESRVWTGYRNTIFYTASGTILSLAVILPAAYVLGSRYFPARKIIMPIFVFTMFFGGGMIPTYLLIRDLHLLDTPVTMVILGAFSVYSCVVARTFIYSSIPHEFYEVAVMDGCSHFKYFVSVILPLSKPIIAVIGLWCAVGHWNSYFGALVYLNSQELMPLQIVLRQLLFQSASSLTSTTFTA